MTSAPRLLVCAFALCALSLASPAGAAGPTLERIQQTATIALGYRDGAPPFSYRDREGRVLGYSIDLCTRAAAAIQKQLGLKELRIEWTALDAANRLDAVAAGRVDAECGTTTITLTRMEQVDFTVPIYVDGGAVLVRSNSKLARLADLKGRRIAVIPGTTTEPALKHALKVIDATAEFLPVKTSAEGVAALLSGKADGYASDRVVLAGLKHAQAGDELTILGSDFSFEPYGLVVRRDDPDFRLAVNRALVGMYKSGDIDAVYVKWLAPLGRPGALLNAMFYLNSIPD